LALRGGATKPTFSVVTDFRSFGVSTADTAVSACLSLPLVAAISLVTHA
jgi:hypothetical protein